MFDNILVVCVGNICRSPAAEGALIKALAEASKPGKKVHSAGISALVDKPADKTSIELMETRGIDITNHKARQLTRGLINEAELVLVMERRHLEDISKLAPHARGKTMLLGKWIGDKEIPDPYRQSRDAFEYAINLIDDCIAKWIKYL
ncbi:low molecular weight protein-tyrosine-phosphatase [Gayadomonas joobiniege]|uniref:low molecular weight protein-tyrosine-phosphatase n=1 Tax=Gayadomonas joobiniege TaxID=1234606 RepID=UPI0003672877|nr:low molecular weight protein-tyrosine-phosphatase [Gayadomonas joobiniege]